MTPRDDWYEYRPRLAGPSGPRARGRKPFGASWWGGAWIEALEQRARLDPNRLPRGRTYARTGAVGPITLARGEVRASVQGSRREPYDVLVRVRQFSAGEWGEIFDALASEIGHTAALLEGELPSGVADQVRSLGLDLLPGPGEVQPRCSCPDWADPCKHSAAVCYLVADALDDDAFGVLLLRGRERAEVLAALRARRFSEAGQSFGSDSGKRATDETDKGVPARQAWLRDLPPAGPPALPQPPPRPGRPTVLASDPPADLGLDIDVMRSLAADAAARALEMARGASASGLELTADEDLARRAAALLATPGADIGEMALRAGVPTRLLLLRALAYRDGGPGGLAVLEGFVEADPKVVAAGARLLGEGASVRRNRVSLGDRQLRLGPDGRWYPFRRHRAGTWYPDGPPLAPPRDESDLGELDEEEPAAPAHWAPSSSEVRGARE